MKLHFTDSDSLLSLHTADNSARATKPGQRGEGTNQTKGTHSFMAKHNCALARQAKLAERVIKPAGDQTHQGRNWKAWLGSSKRQPCSRQGRAVRQAKLHLSLFFKLSPSFFCWASEVSVPGSAQILSFKGASMTILLSDTPFADPYSE